MRRATRGGRARCAARGSIAICEHRNDETREEMRARGTWEHGDGWRFCLSKGMPRRYLSFTERVESVKILLRSYDAPRTCANTTRPVAVYVHVPCNTPRTRVTQHATYNGHTTRHVHRAYNTPRTLSYDTQQTPVMRHVPPIHTTHRAPSISAKIELSLAASQRRSTGRWARGRHPPLRSRLGSWK